MIIRIPCLAIGIAFLIDSVYQLTNLNPSLRMIFFVVSMLILGFSFIPRPKEEEKSPYIPAVKGVWKIFYDPSQVFQHLRWRSQWAIPFAVIALCSIIHTITFTQRVTPQAIAEATIESVINKGWIPPEMVEEIKQDHIESAAKPSTRVIQVLSAIINPFLLLALIAAFCLAGVYVCGGSINYWQALSVATYATLPPFALQKILSIVVLYLKDVSDIDPIMDQATLVHADLSLLFSPVDHPYIHAIATCIGFFSVYGLYLTAIGLKIAAKRISAASAWFIAVVWWCLVIINSVITAALFTSKS
jgi:Yip1 domain